MINIFLVVILLFFINDCLNLNINNNNNNNQLKKNKVIFFNSRLREINFL